MVCAVVAADPLAVYEVKEAFWGPPQPRGPRTSCLVQHHPGHPADQVSASTAVSSFPSLRLSRGASGAFRLRAYPLPALDVPAMGLASFQRLVTTPLLKVIISFQAAS